MTVSAPMSSAIGEGQQEDLQSRAAGGTDERERAEHERDVGGDRACPTPCAPAPLGLMARNSNAGSTMPPSAAAMGTSGAAAVGQLAHRELALDLQADDEEEQRHQPVVDPVPKVEFERPRPTLSPPGCARTSSRSATTASSPRAARPQWRRAGPRRQGFRRFRRAAHPAASRRVAAADPGRKASVRPLFTPGS